MGKHPKRPESHVIGDLGPRYINSIGVLPRDWYVEEPKKDYGVDLWCSIVEENEVPGFQFGIQCKSIHVNAKTEYVLVQKIKRTTINFWRQLILPVVIIAYIESENRAYWCWFDEGDFELGSERKLFSIKISKNNVLDSNAWKTIADRTKTIFLRKKLMDKIVDFEPINTDDESSKLAWKFFLENRFWECLGECSKLQSKFPDGATWWYLASVCQYEIHNYQDALISINDAIERVIGKDLLSEKQMRWQKACILTEYGRSKGSLSFLHEAEAMFTELGDVANSAIYHYNYGNVLSALNKFEEARVEYEKSLIENPNDEKVLKNLGTAHFGLGNHKVEISLYDKALRINPELEEATISKGITLMIKFNRYKDGISLLESITDKKAQEKIFPRFFGYLAYGCLFLKDYVKALEWVEQGLRNNSDDRSLLLLKRTAYMLAIANNMIPTSAISFFEFEIRKHANDFVAIQQVLRICELQGVMGSDLWSEIADRLPAVVGDVPLLLGQDDYGPSDFVESLSSLALYSHFRIHWPISLHLDQFPLRDQEFREVLNRYLYFVFGILFHKGFRAMSQFKKRSVPTKLFDQIAKEIFTENVRLSIAGIRFVESHCSKNTEEDAISSREPLLLLYFMTIGKMELEMMTPFINQFGFEAMEIDTSFPGLDALLVK